MISLSLRQRFMLWLRGYVFVFTKDRGLGRLKYYAVRCRTHGLYVDYPHGYRQEFSCPKCEKAVKNTWRSWK